MEETLDAPPGFIQVNQHVEYMKQMILTIDTHVMALWYVINVERHSEFAL